MDCSGTIHSSTNQQSESKADSNRRQRILLDNIRQFIAHFLYCLLGFACRLRAKLTARSGRIFDPDSGSTYDSTISLKSSDSLRVQGCALGGMFCGGQTWTRVN